MLFEQSRKPWFMVGRVHFLPTIPPTQSGKGFGERGPPTLHTPRLLDWKAGMNLTLIWLCGHFPPHRGEAGPTVMAF